MKHFFIVLLTIIMTSCASGTWLGEEDTSPRLEGKRENALAANTSVSNSIILKNIKVKIPFAKANNGWPSSNESQNVEYLPQNIALQKKLKKTATYKLQGYNNPKYSHVSPIVMSLYRGDLLFAMANSEVTAYKLDKKFEVAWHTKLYKKGPSEAAGGGIVFSHNMLFITNGNKDVFAIDSVSGKIKWEYKMPYVSRAAPTIHDNHVLVPTLDNKLYALNRDSGKLVWKHEGAPEDLAMIQPPSVAANKNIIVAPYSSGELYILEDSTGNEFYKANLASNNLLNSGFSLKGFSTTPIINDSNLFALNDEGVLTSISLLSGQENWRVNMNRASKMWLAGDFIYLLGKSGELYCVYKKNGLVKWHSEVPMVKKATLYGPVMAGSQLLIARSNGELLFISPFDGKIQKTIKTKLNLVQQPIIMHSKLYLVSGNGTISIWQ